MANPQARVSYKIGARDYKEFRPDGRMYIDVLPNHEVFITSDGCVHNLPDDARIDVFKYVPNTPTGAPVWTGNPFNGSFRFSQGEALTIRFSEVKNILGISWTHEE